MGAWPVVRWIKVEVEIYSVACGDVVDHVPELSGRGVAAQLRGLYYDLAGAPVPRQLSSLLAMTGPSHLLYGTDWAWTPEAAIAAITAGINATPLLDQDQVAAMMTTTNGPPARPVRHLKAESPASSSTTRR